MCRNGLGFAMMRFDELLWKEPWLSPVILNIKNRIPTRKIDTAGITPDGKTLYYNPRFWRDLSDSEKVAVQLHEVLHIANLHSIRRGKRDKELWNWACDMSINYLIENSGYNLPLGTLCGVDDSAENIYEKLSRYKTVAEYDKDFIKRYLSEEFSRELLDGEIKYLLSDRLSSNNIALAHYFCACGRGISYYLSQEMSLDGDLLVESKEQNQDITETIEAINEAQALAGKGTTKLSKRFNVIESKTDWRVVLQSLVKSITGDDVDYVSYEFDEFGICEDVLTNKPKLRICVLVDESGSISDTLYSMFIGELNKLSKVADVFASGFTDDTPLDAVPLKKYKRTMSGGTCVLRAYNDAIASDFDNIIILTDGYLEFPEKEPKPTIWAMPKSFGRNKEVIIY